MKRRGNGMSRGIRKRLALVAALGMVLAACGGGIEETDSGGSADGEECGDLNIAINPWTGYVSNAYVIGHVAQTELGQAPWEFHIVAGPEINAFNIPGGHVYVYTGLIQATDNVSELAGVMAHEISHGVARHGTEQLSKAYGFQVVAGLALGANPPIYQQLVAQIVGAGTFAAFGRDAEREADRLGVFTMHAAGYDPHGMVTMFQELLSRRDNQPGAVSQFFSSHPLTEDRITDVRAMIAELPPRSNLITRDAELSRIQQRLSGYSR